MAVNSAQNILQTQINNAYSNLRQSASSIGGFTSTTNQLGDAFDNLTRELGGQIPPTSSQSSFLKSSVGQVDNAISGAGGLRNVGKAIRMVGNAPQNVSTGAAPTSRQPTKAVISKSAQLSTFISNDWRVSLSIPTEIQGGEVLRPLADTDNRMIFPFTPTILIGHTANYTQITPTHVNYPYNAYENSQVDNYTITGEFVNESTSDGKYFIACLHFLRTATKMFYGGDDANTLGLPPVVSRLNGYGKHVLNNIPVVITNFTTDFPNDVDYVETMVDGELNMVPTQCTITVTCAPQYARRSQARFSLKTFADGGFVGTDEGFV